MTYSFNCSERGSFDTILSIHSPSEELNKHPCPICGKIAIRKFYPTGIVFKGLGFYVTDTPSAKNSTI